MAPELGVDQSLNCQARTARATAHALIGPGAAAPEPNERPRWWRIRRRRSYMLQRAEDAGRGPGGRQWGGAGGGPGAAAPAGRTRRWGCKAWVERVKDRLGWVECGLPGTRRWCWPESGGPEGAVRDYCGPVVLL